MTLKYFRDSRSGDHILLTDTVKIVVPDGEGDAMDVKVAVSNGHKVKQGWDKQKGAVPPDVLTFGCDVATDMLTQALTEIS